MSGDEVIKQYTTISHCEVCGKSYLEENVRIVGHQDEIWVLYVYCGSCHSQSLLAALIDADEDEESKPESVENISDLDDNETEKFANITITSDDLLDMYNFLTGFKGGFSQLFG